MVSVFKIWVFLDKKPCQLAHSYRRFETRCCLHLQVLTSQGQSMSFLFCRALQTVGQGFRYSYSRGIWQHVTLVCTSGLALISTRILLQSAKGFGLAVPWLRRLVAGLSPPRPGFDPRLSQWPRCLRRGSAAVRLLGLWVRIPPGAWMFVLC